MATKRPSPVPSEFSVEHAESSFEYSKFVSKKQVNIDVIEVPFGRFPVCPICLEPDPESEEHLPPESLGGRVMTWTCRLCNNGFGTAEEELRRYLELELKVQAFSIGSGSVRGHRRATVALRSTPTRPGGAFVRSSAPDFNDVLADGPSQLRVTPLDMDLVRVAALKQAYLAACLLLREVPSSRAVGRVRAILLAARDRDRSNLTRRLSDENVDLPGWVEADGLPSLVLVEPSVDVPDWLFVLAGGFTVQWPFDDLRLSVDDAIEV